MSDFDQLSTYDFQLPPELIAQEPLPERDASRLLVIHRRDGRLAHHTVRDLPELLAPGDCLVLNNSRVLPARLHGLRTKTGGKWEGLFLGEKSSGHWRLIGQTRGWLEVGETVTIPSRSYPADPPMVLCLEQREPEGIWLMTPQQESPSISGRREPSLIAPATPSHLRGSTLELLQHYGEMPLPPYIERNVTAADTERYQTTYASQPGSVAAPTAGLHLTPELLARCRTRGLETAEVTLHVGIGTFRPVSTPDLAQHVMHAEYCQLPESTARQLAGVRQRGGRIVAVGTTSLRTLESAFQAQDADPTGWNGETRLFIRPPYQVQSVDALLTNFHLPKSTLFMLVCALAGVDVTHRAYQAAIDQRYRFFSYGDAMLIV